MFQGFLVSSKVNYCSKKIIHFWTFLYALGGHPSGHLLLFPELFEKLPGIFYIIDINVSINIRRD